MSEHDTSGPAFPVPEQRNPYDGSGILEGSAGMSLRDYFAGQALVGLCGNTSWDDTFNNPSATAKCAYALADAMMAARKGGTE